MIKKRVLPVLLAALLLFSGTCLAENMQFVDANGTTGYYVDVDSIEFSTDKVWIQPDPIPAQEPGKPAVVPQGYMAEVEIVAYQDEVADEKGEYQAGLSQVSE